MLYNFLRDTFRFFSYHWIPLLTISLVVGLVFDGLSLIIPTLNSNSARLSILADAIHWLGSISIAAASILYIRAAVDDQYVSPYAAIHQGLKFVLPLIGLQLLLVLGAFAIMLFVIYIPGLRNAVIILAAVGVICYLGMRLFMMAMIALIVEKTSIIQAIRLAWSYSRGYLWSLLGAHLAYLAASMGLALVVVSMTINDHLKVILLLLLLKPFSILLYIFIFRVYTDSQQRV